VSGPAVATGPASGGSAVIARRVSLIVVVGIATGALTQVGQSVLPDGWSQAANAISPWLFVAFALGAAMPDRRWAVVAGVAALILSLVGYYLMIELRYGYGGSRGSLLLWGTGALVAGTVFGVAGQWWRRGGPWQVAAAIGVLAAVFVAEGIYQIGIQPDAAIGAGFVVVGLIVPLVLGRSWGERGRGYLALVPALALGALGFVALFAFASLTAGIGA
jgi:Family of unknown function (DUF6518)